MISRTRPLLSLRHRSFARPWLPLVVAVPLLTVFAGCDYWPPALQAQIEELRSMVEDAWDERDDLDRQRREADRRNKELTRHAATLAQRNHELEQRVAALEQALAAKADRPVTRPASFRSSRADGFRSGGIRAGRMVAAFTGARLLRLQSPPMRGTDVRAVQNRLRKRNIPVQADGIYGTATRAAVIRFQRAHGLRPDGIVGPKTWASLTRTSRK